jgi:hypothetical protein
MPLEELEQKRAEFEAYLAQLRQAREDNRHLLKVAGERLIDEVINHDLRELQEKQGPVLLAGLARVAQESGDLSGHVLLERLNAYVQSSIEAVYADWIVREEKRLTEMLQQSLDRFGNQINQALRDLAKVSRELFRAEVGDLSAGTELAGHRQFYFAPWQMQVSPDVLSGSLLYLLPGRWVRPRLLAAVRAKLVEQLDMHGGRVRYDFVRRLEESLHGYERGIIESMDATIVGIEEAIRRAAAQKRKVGEDASARDKELADQEMALLSVSHEIESPLPGRVGQGGT